MSAVAIAGSAIMVLGLAPPTALAGPSKPDGKTTVPAFTGGKDPYQSFDSRRSGPAAKTFLRERERQLDNQPNAGVRKLRSQLGAQGLLQIDPITATPRNVAKLDGFLTGPSEASAPSIALSYLRSRPDVFGLSEADIAALDLRKDYVDIAGTHHLNFVQSAAGIPVFGNGLKVNVTKKGEIVNITGSPAPNLSAVKLPPATINADQARTKSAQAVASSAAPATKKSAPGPAGTVEYSNGDKVNPTAFVTTDGVRRAWQALVWTTNGKLYQHIIDATTGKVLYRQSLTNNDSAQVFDNYPGAPYGGQQTKVSLKPTWLPKNSPWLAGNVGKVYADMNDNDKADMDEQIPPSAPGAFEFPQKPVEAPGYPCDQHVCTWDPAKGDSWRDNVKQGSANMMYHLGKFHDKLAAAPVGFTRQAGNFEAVDGDGITAESFDGAAMSGGLPGNLNRNNADFSAAPDGKAPRMQMYLWAKPFSAAFSGDDASIIYHEYSHGLSWRLVTYADGSGALDSWQSAAMGEAWGDWYGMSYLASQNLERDTTKPGELIVANHSSGGKGIRTQPIDCPVGTTAKACPGAPTAGSGGYTYGDYTRIDRRGGPWAHADGEIWAQTLWQLRTAIGAPAAEGLVTRAMEFAPENPSFLDMRNSILLADTMLNNGGKRATIWKTFASRGMGFFASTNGGNDLTPVEDFSLPPTKGTPTGTITGTVITADTKKPLAGVTVGVNGHNTGIPGDYSGKTDATGKYTISNVVAGTYPAISSSGIDGYEAQSRPISVPSRNIVANWELRRNWASSAGGATIAGVSPPDLTKLGLGPSNLIDQSPRTGWVSAVLSISGTPLPQYAVIKMPAAVKISGVYIDPTSTRFDTTASTKDYRVETSLDGKTWRVAATGTFTTANLRRLNPVTLEPNSEPAQFVRYTTISPQVPGDFAAVCKPGTEDPQGCVGMASAELTVYGTAA